MVSTTEYSLSACAISVCKRKSGHAGGGGQTARCCVRVLRSHRQRLPPNNPRLSKTAFCPLAHPLDMRNSCQLVRWRQVPVQARSQISRPKRKTIFYMTDYSANSRSRSATICFLSSGHLITSSSPVFTAYPILGFFSSMD